MQLQRAQFSVVIPTCQRNDLLSLCLERLKPGEQIGMTLVTGAVELAPGSPAEGETAPPCYEVIVSDDGETSTAEDLVRTRFPWARWARGPRRGPAANRNYGAGLAAGTWIAFVDDDCLPEPRWLLSYSEGSFISHPAVMEGATLACGIRDRADMECPENPKGGCFWSCNVAILRSVMTALGGFDENFPGPAMEDIDLRIRLQRAGHRPVFAGGAVVYHPWRKRKGWAFVWFHSKSLAFFLRKHPAESVNHGAAACARSMGRHLLRVFPKSFRDFGPASAIRELYLNVLSLIFLAIHRVRL